VVDAGEHLADRPVRCELKYERTQELRPRRAGELDAVADPAGEAIQLRHRQHVTDVTRASVVTQTETLTGRGAALVSRSSSRRCGSTRAPGYS
jgi:hypothetical protein